jgi:hypothetical protein
VRCRGAALPYAPEPMSFCDCKGRRKWTFSPVFKTSATLTVYNVDEEAED